MEEGKKSAFLFNLQYREKKIIAIGGIHGGIFYAIIYIINSSVLIFM